MRQPFRFGKRIVFAGILLAGGLDAYAADDEAIGPLYPIGEPHLLEFIRQRLQDKAKSGELAQLRQQVRDRGVDAVLQPKPVAGVGRTQTARTFTVDPSFTLPRNLTDGTGHVLFAAGTRINPLAIMPLAKRLLFFDARDPRQIERARAWIATTQANEPPIKPILVGGSYLELMRAWRTRVYYDQGGTLTRRLGITQVPALVSQDGLRLRVEERRLP